MVTRSRATPRARGHWPRAACNERHRAQPWRTPTSTGHKPDATPIRRRQTTVGGAGSRRPPNVRLGKTPPGHEPIAAHIRRHRASAAGRSGPLPGSKPRATPRYAPADRVHSTTSNQHSAQEADVRSGPSPGSKPRATPHYAPADRVHSTTSNRHPSQVADVRNGSFAQPGSKPRAMPHDATCRHNIVDTPARWPVRQSNVCDCRKEVYTVLS